METPYQYHSTVASHGNYQFTLLKDLIDGLLMDRLEEDSFIKNTNRNILIYHAKMGIKNMTKLNTAAHMAIEMTVGKEGFVVLPQNFVSLNRVSVALLDPFTGSRRLYPLDITQSIITATGYLQDNNAKILFDDDGNIITADASNAYNIPHQTFEFSGGSNPFLDTSNLSEFGEAKVDELNGKLIVSATIIDKEIVIEYDSDGLQWEAFNEGAIKVPKFLEQVIKDYTYYATIEKRQTVPANEKQRALMRYKTTRFEAVKASAKIDLIQINRLMRTKSKNL